MTKEKAQFLAMALLTKFTQDIGNPC